MLFGFFFVFVSNGFKLFVIIYCNYSSSVFDNIFPFLVLFSLQIFKYFPVYHILSVCVLFVDVSISPYTNPQSCSTCDPRNCNIKLAMAENRFWQVYSYTVECLALTFVDCHCEADFTWNCLRFRVKDKVLSAGDISHLGMATCFPT